MSLEELLSTSKVVSLHLVLSPRTRGIIAVQGRVRNSFSYSTS